MFNDNLAAPTSIEEAAKGFEEVTNAYHITIPDNAHGGRGFALPAIMFKNRILYLHGPVTQEAVQALCMQLHYLCSEPVLKTAGRPRRITFYVNSPGGLVGEGLTLFNYLRQAEAITGEPVVTIIQTMGASMGSFLPQAATPGFRIMLPYSEMMIHSLSYGTQGKREAHTRGTGSTRVMMAKLYEVYIDKMTEARVLFGGQDDTPELRGEVLRWLMAQMENEDVFMSPLQTLEAGLTDFVAHSEEEQFAYYRALYRYHGLLVEKPNPEVPGETMLDNVEKGEDGRLIPVKLTEDEKTKALAEVNRLRAINLEKTREFEARRLPIVAALKALDNVREDEGRGVQGDRGKAYDAAAEAFIASLKNSDNS